MIPWANPRPQSKQHHDQFSCFCTHDHRLSLYFTMRCPSPLKIAPSHGGSGPHLIHGSLGPPESSTQMASRSVQPFCRAHKCDRPTDRPHLHRESKKRCHPNHRYNFVNSLSICKILSLLQTAVNFQQNPYWVTHHTLSMLLHYLGKLKNQKFALCIHVKHVSSVIFYYQSNRYLPNVMKISAKINTMQNNNILLFVRLLSLTSLIKALQLSKVCLSNIKHQHSKNLTRWTEAS